MPTFMVLFLVFLDYENDEFGMILIFERTVPLRRQSNFLPISLGNIFEIYELINVLFMSIFYCLAYNCCRLNFAPFLQLVLLF